MSTMWPSEKTRTTPASKSAPVKAVVPTDWVTGWVMTLFIIGVVVIVLALLLPIAAHALDTMTTFTDSLNRATRRGA